MIDTNSKGYLSLSAAAQKDCSRSENCFNPNGCDKPTRGKCFHRYCNKFKWVLDRVQHYADKTGLNASEILDAWELRRDYWYMNYYQDSCQPLIDGNVRVFETSKEYVDSLKGRDFICPSCGKETELASRCEACGWTSYGLFGTLGRGSYVFIKGNMALLRIFMPVGWSSTPSGVRDESNSSELRPAGARVESTSERCEAARNR